MHPDTLGPATVPAGVDSPLGIALRAALAVVIVAAFFVDLWALGDLASRPSQLAVIALAISAVIWARWPDTTVPISAVIAILSMLATLDSSRDDLRFALFTELVIMPVLFGALLARPSRSRCWLAGAIAVTGEGICLRAGQTPIRAIVAISMLVLLGAAGTAVVYIRLRDSERRASVDIARQTERLELARDLHDVVGHHVTGIVVLAQASRFAAPHRVDPGSVDETMAAIETAGLETLVSIRRLVGLLRTDAPLKAPPSLAELELLVADLRRTHPNTQLDIDDQLRIEGFPVDLATTVQRLTQEAVTNVRKHGNPAEPVVFSFSISGSALHLIASNALLVDAVGHGFGLIGMRERLDALGGTLSSRAEAGRWVLRVALPLDHENQILPAR